MSNRGSFLYMLIKETSKIWKTSLSYALAIQIISNLQITFLTIQQASGQDWSPLLFCLKILQRFSTRTVILGEISVLQSDTTALAASFLCIVYFLFHKALIITVFLRNRNRKPESPKFPLLISKLYLIHSRILFLPIHYFLLWYIAVYSGSINDKSNTVARFGKMGLLSIILLCLFNFILAFFRELFSYQIGKSRDALATKNNMFSKLTILHKAIHLLVFFLFNSSVKYLALIILNLSLCLLYCWDLLYRLSFYNISILKLNAAFALTHTLIAIIFTANYAGLGKDYSETILIVTIPLAIKIYFKYLAKSLRRLLTLDFTTPEEAAQFLILLKVYMGYSSSAIKSKSEFHKAYIFRYGILSLYRRETKQDEPGNEGLGDNQEVYLAFVRQCHNVLRKYPRSELLLVVIAQAYLTKVGNTAKSLKIINRLLATDLSVPAQNTVRAIMDKIERTYSPGSKRKLEVLRYFEEREFGNRLKDIIQKEISEHIKFWRELCREKIDIKSVIDIANTIDKTSTEVARTWSSSLGENRRSLEIFSLMHGIYLKVTRGIRDEGNSMGQPYENPTRVKNYVNFFAENVVVFLVSIELEKLGRIKDASSSVRNVFKVEKEKLIGQKLDNLMPRLVAKDHDSFILRYSHIDARDMSRQLTTIGKTIEGNFFEMELEVRMFPSLADGLNLVSRIKQTKGEELMMIADQKGTVIECSRDLSKMLKIFNKDMGEVKMMELCPDFEAPHYSFNICYYGDKEVVIDPGDAAMERDMADSGINRNYLKSIQTQPGKFIPSEGNQGKLLLDLQAIGTHNSLKRLQTESSFSVKFLSKVLRQTIIYSGANEAERRVSSPSAPIRITKEIAQEVCERLKSGIKLSFYPLEREKSSNKRIEKIEFIVVMEPYIVNGVYYKLIKLKQFFIEQKIVDFLKGDTVVTFPNEPVPEILLQKRRTMTPVFRKTKDALRKSKKEQGFADIFKKISLFNKGEAFGKMSTVPVEKNLEDSTTLKHDSFKGIDAVENLTQRNSAFSKNSSHSEIQIKKALEKLYQKQELRPVTKFSVFSVYFSTFVVLVLTMTDYLFSKDSIGGIRDGVEIVKNANDRLIDTIVAWQWMLIIYARSVGIRAIVPSFIEISKSMLAERTARMLQKNNDLKIALEAINNKDFTNIFYSKDIAFWQPSTKQLFSYDYIDISTATKVLATKYAEVARFNKSVLLLENNENVLFAINNTANGFIQKSQQQVNQAENILQNIMKSNKSLLIGLLVLKISSLALVLVSLILLVRVVFLSYTRLFRALTKIKHSKIRQRLSELELIRTCLKQDIESQGLSYKLQNYFEENSFLTGKPAAKAKKNRLLFEEDNFSLKSLLLQIYKYLLVAIGLLGVLTVAFCLAFYQSTLSFNSLELLYSRVSVAHRLGHDFDTLLPFFYFFIIFENYPNYLIQGQDPEGQFTSSLEFLRQANHILLASLTDPDQGLSDPVLQDFFQHNICDYIQNSVVSSCEIASKGGVLGFSGLNTQYVETHAIWASEYMRNKTYDNAKVVLAPYATEIINDVTVVEEAYEFLSNHLLEGFNTAVDTKNAEGLSLFIIVFVSIFVASVIIRLATIRKLKEIDLATKKILRVVPVRVIKDTKILGAFLISEYKEELEGIRRFLQNS